MADYIAIPSPTQNFRKLISSLFEQILKGSFAGFTSEVFSKIEKPKPIPIANGQGLAIAKLSIAVMWIHPYSYKESEGTFEYGNYQREADDLGAVIQHFSEANHVIIGILRHSKGGDAVLLYASRYHDIHTVVNVSERYDLKRGIVEHLGEDFMQRLKEKGYVDTKDRKIHGSEDEIIPVEDAYELTKALFRRATLLELIKEYHQAANDIQRLISILKTHRKIQRGINLTDSGHDIKKAYYKDALKYHSDKIPYFFNKLQTIFATITGPDLDPDGGASARLGSKNFDCGRTCLATFPDFSDHFSTGGQKISTPVENFRLGSNHHSKVVKQFDWGRNQWSKFSTGVRLTSDRSRTILTLVEYG
ncbi:Alpha/Beta hydrolase [Trema orientale]|uniref:Alpha/Beta hydrolase n=1 Tax=Trema orientale TaxID=63057 RepID=A0A2P5AIX1_TREOI|nr:Alpha/Beta hydrolase [Trema orientale]